LGGGGVGGGLSGEQDGREVKCGEQYEFLHGLKLRVLRFSIVRLSLMICLSEYNLTFFSNCQSIAVLWGIFVKL
jgi:hypothetical protein